MDTVIKERVEGQSASTYIFMQNKVFLDDIVNLTEVRKCL